MGREALLEERARGSRRRTIGLVADGAPFPWLEDFWPVLAADGNGRSASRAGRSTPMRSSATSRSRSWMPAVGDDDRLIVRAPDGDRAARVHAIPFVT